MDKTEDQPLTELTLRLGEASILMNRWVRMNKYAKRDYMKRIAWQVRSQLNSLPSGLPFELSLVHIYRYSSQLPDWDGLYGGCKPLLDCLIVPHPRINPYGVGIIRGDSPREILQLHATPVKCKRGAEKTIVVIEGQESA